MKFKERFDNGEKVLHELTEFLKEWLEDHLKVQDHKYSDYFIEKGYIK